MNCVFCKRGLDDDTQPTVQLRDKGCEAINALTNSLSLDLTVIPGQRVHRDCRRDFCRQKELRRSSKSVTNLTDEYKRLLSNGGFDFELHCLFCGQNAKVKGCKRGYDVYPVLTFDFQIRIREACARRKDEWSSQVLARLEFAQDLPAAEAIYHQTCNVNFRTTKQIPICKQTGHESIVKSPKGRPENRQQYDAFVSVTQYLEENDDEQMSVNDLVLKMEELFPGNAYSVVYMKKKLIDHYKDQIVITELNGISNVVTFKTTASSILNAFYNQPKDMTASEQKLSIIKAAAKLIQSEIKEMYVSKETYPSPPEFSSLKRNTEYLPDSLNVFLSALFPKSTNGVKIASIGQTMIQTVRPRLSLSPLQLGLAVQLHNQYSSRFLIDVLNKLGFCSSYKEVMRFETSAAVANGVHIPGITSLASLQFAADNVDHNIRSLDGHDTFHGMGIIAAVTPGVSENTPIPRVRVTNEDIVSSGRINLKFYKPLLERPCILLKGLKPRNIQDQTQCLDIVLKVARIVKLSTVPGWSGFMQSVQDGHFPGISSIKFLPMIDLNPGDLSCIYSTLHFVCEEARKYQITPIVTFDQPLYWKAISIVQSESINSPLKNVVLRLGGFHLQMSFLGSVGHIMHATGLHDVMETVYAPNAVEHMMSGKAVSRAMRGHLLVDSALNTLVTSEVYGIQVPIEHRQTSDCSGETFPIPAEELGENITVASEGGEHHVSNTEQDTDIQRNADNDLKTISALYDQLISKEISHDSVKGHPVVENVKTKLDTKLIELKQFPTACLWVQYMEMVNILRRFIKAERTGNWELHLQTVEDMLPYLAASGHNLYVKSAYLYLQQMNDLQNTHPDVYNNFVNGHHVVRRSDRYWAGLSTDLTIEQTLMRTLKSTGGMTRGKGMTEIQRAQWLLSMPICAAVNSSMQTLTETSYETSEQHKECSNSRQERDHKDLNTILTFLEERKPFVPLMFLRNIETGVTSAGDVCAHKAKETGCEIVQNLEGKNVMDVSFKKSKQIVTMNSQSTLQVGNEVIPVSPQVLFQRLLVAATGQSNDMDVDFTHELCPVPASLFDNTDSMREAQKATLADAIWSQGDCAANIEEDEQTAYVLDGGSLLHRIPWPRGYTFQGICQLYADFACRRYGSPTVIFDGYLDGPSTKDAAHQRRSKGVIGTNVLFTKETPFRSKKDHFLANNANKQAFIYLLAETLQAIGCKVIHARADADVTIVKTAVESAFSQPTTLIGEDTDLLVLLCYHADLQTNDIIFRSDKNSSSNRKPKHWSIQKTKNVLGFQMCYILPALHALTGCDTNSRIFGIGKGNTLKKVKSSEWLQTELADFQEGTSQEQVANVGERILVALYNGSSFSDVNNLRLRIFTEKTINSLNTVQIHKLPPTSSAAKYHCLRAHLQTREWTEAAEMDATLWGWKLANELYVPVRTDMPPAPAELLAVIRCKCKVNCDSRRCSCRKHGLDCSFACKECKGSSCSNSSESDFSLE